MKIYHVTYWDPCNGMGGSAQSKGYYTTERLARQSFAGKDVGIEKHAYNIREIDVLTEEEAITVLDELKEFFR